MNSAATDYDRQGPAAARPPLAPAGVNGASRSSTVYYAPGSTRRSKSSTPVPVDQFGHITHTQFRCRKCKTASWFPLGVAAKGVPVCDVDGVRMTVVPIRRPSWLLWTAAKSVARGEQFRAVWALAASAAGGAAAYDASAPAVAYVAASVPFAIVAARMTRIKFARRAYARRNLAPPTPERSAHTGRIVGYSTAAYFMWLALASQTGIDPHTVAGRTALTSLALLWLLPAATWWRWLRRIAAALAARPIVVATVAPEQDPEPDDEVPMDPDEAYVRTRWSTIVAVHKDAVISTAANGTPIKAPRAGRLPDTWLEEWHPVAGGWGATIVGPDGLYTGDKLVAAAGGVASAFKMKTPMVKIIPDTEDENRALVLVQRTSPLNDVVRWTGPDSINVNSGTAPIARYADGTLAYYEIYRPGWGSPAVAVFGTTGSGKSETLNQMFAIDRWASYVDEDGARRGLVASFLIDPQQGQSFAPFVDDLAAPVATSLDEAKLLVEAFTREMLRRNWYLTRVAKTWDPRRKKWRKGRKWWNPVLDGPILTLTIDEAHDYLSDREFATMLTKGARMWRKCGGQIRLGTHTPLLTDLGGSMALRDMLTGGFVVVCRTANSLTGPTAFNGRLPVDPRTIPDVPGSSYILSGLAPKPMLARVMWEPDYYDWVRDLEDRPIGYPAPLPPETLEAFGADFAKWVQHAAAQSGEPFAPATAPPAPEVPKVCVDAVRIALANGAANGPMTITEIDAELRIVLPDREAYTVRTIREAVGNLVKAGEVTSADRRHMLTESALANVREILAATADGLSDVA